MDAIRLSPSTTPVLARLLIASGELAKARERLEIGLELAEQTRMHVYDAELLRLRAHTTDDIGARRECLEAAFELAEHQDAPIFQLRAAIDLFALDGAPARHAVSARWARFPTGAVGRKLRPPWQCSSETARGEGRHHGWRHGGVERRLAAK